MDRETWEQDIDILKTRPLDLSNFSDGNHSFEDLYNHRSILFAALVNQMPDRSWKTRFYDDGKPIEGDYFLAGIDIEGAIRYHIKEKFWDLFQCEELDYAPAWDGSTPDDCLDALEDEFCTDDYFESDFLYDDTEEDDE